MRAIPARSLPRAAWRSPSSLVDGLDQEADPLLIAKAQRPRGFQNAVAVHRFGPLGHRRSRFRIRPARFRTQAGASSCCFACSVRRESLYLFCTWTSAFERFWRLWRFGFPKVLGNLDCWADRLPAPPPLPLYEECFRCASIVQGSVRLSAGLRAGPHVRGSTGTSCAAVRLYGASVRRPRVRVAGRRAIVVR